MSALSGTLATLLTLAVLIVTAGCDDGKSIPVNGYAPAHQLVHKELQPTVSTLQSGTAPLENRLESRMQALERRIESRMESIEDRLTLLNSRMEELTGRLDGQQTRLDEVITQLNGQKSQQDKATVTVNDHTERLSAIAINMGKHVSEMRKLATRLDSQQPQLRELSTQLDDGDSQQKPVEAYCDMVTTGGNWTVIQRRDDIKPRQDFNLGWKDYKTGFGNVTQEFWWGLEHLFQLTSKIRQYELRIDFEAFDGNRSYATYQGFGVSSELDGYILSISNYTGTAGDSLSDSVNGKFSTRDRDQDGWSTFHCAQYHQGAWWYGSRCGLSSLNGRYRDGGDGDLTGIWWYEWRRDESLKKTEMRIRPTYN
ncbi:techylectin-5B-like [Amphibalanus amphitrite]|uniref:techylectin-5B-like n=1 Tax=Amphibalanus amphitrite TaxID=1232801 RepID=UPI001C916129|nr:techylectin-5B-like [Amphibalanus amphitrite]